MRSFNLLLVLLAFVSCSKKTTLPNDEFIDSDLEPKKDINLLLEEKSYLTINYSLNKKGIRDTFQYFIDTYMTEPMLFPDYSVTAIMKRNGDMNVEFDGKQVLINLPLTIAIEKNTLLGRIKADGEMTVSLVSEIIINPYWQFSTKTKLVTHEWTKKPRMKLGVSIPIETIANKILERMKPQIETSIDDNMRLGFDLKARIQNVSNLTLVPYKLNEIYGGWMTTQVDTAYMNGAMNRKDETEGKITLAARTFISSEKPNVSPIAKTPVFAWKENLPDSSKLNLQLDLSYAYLESIANENVRGQVYSDGDKKITIHNIKITGDDQNRLVVNAEVFGTFRGIVLIKGKPFYDKNQKMLKATDVDVSIKTGNIIHSAAAFLLKGKIRKEIAKMMEFPLAEKVADTQKQVDEMLKKFNTTNNVNTTAKIGSLDIAATLAEETRLRSMITVTFYLHTYMDNLSYFRQ